MSAGEDSRARPSRRRFVLAGTAALAGAAGAAGGALLRGRAAVESAGQTEPFWGAHQAGILTPAQRHTYFAAFDLAATKRDEVVRLLLGWTNAAARLAQGLPIEPFAETEIVYAPDTSTVVTSGADDEPKPMVIAAPDSGEAQGLPASRLTLTFGFGAGLFARDGSDRYGLAKRRPEALVDMPRFAGDQLVAERSGGDLSVQACADDPQVAFHAVRQLARLADGVAQLRWTQAGFLPGSAPGETPRNLMGFKDGTDNPAAADGEAMSRIVWVGEEGPEWMRGGSYLVARRIRMALEHWDRSTLELQEQTMGRHKASGAPLRLKDEFAPLPLDARDRDGNPIIAENAHVRLVAAASNDGAQIFRRGYSYNDGVNVTAERWPPWRQGLEYDAGLFFLCYQRDPRAGFLRLFERMAKLDMLNQFVTHVGGGLFACPGGARPGEFIGQRLFAGA